MQWGHHTGDGSINCTIILPLVLNTIYVILTGVRHYGNSPGSTTNAKVYANYIHSGVLNHTITEVLTNKMVIGNTAIDNWILQIGI